MQNRTVGKNAGNSLGISLAMRPQITSSLESSDYNFTKTASPKIPLNNMKQDPNTHTLALFNY